MIGGLVCRRCLAFAAVRLCPKYCVIAAPLGGAHKMRQSDLLEWDFLANTKFLRRFVTCVAMMFCVLRGRRIWKPVNVTVSFSSGGRSTLCACAFCNSVAALMNRSVRAADTVSKVVAGTAFCEVLEKWRNRRKNHTF